MGIGRGRRWGGGKRRRRRRKREEEGRRRREGGDGRMGGGGGEKDYEATTDPIVNGTPWNAGRSAQGGRRGELGSERHSLAG